MQNELSLRRVQRADWDWIPVWFEDAWLNRELGPMDLDWLDHVLTSTEGVELVAIDGDDPIGLIGICWASEENQHHTITDLAIAPQLRGKGLGRRVLLLAMDWPGHPKTSAWIAYVARSNEAPKSLLLSLGWEADGFVEDMQRFRIATAQGPFSGP